MGQIEKQIEVIKAFYHIDEETIFLESAIFKINSSLLFDERQIQNIIKESHSEIVTVSRDFFVISKTGRRSEIDELHAKLKPFRDHAVCAFRKNFGFQRKNGNHQFIRRITIIN